MSVTGMPFTRETDPDWYRDHVNLAELWSDLVDRGETPDNPRRFMEKPYQWQTEWERYCQSLRVPA